METYFVLWAEKAENDSERPYESAGTSDEQG
jgi:hypothetical protein